MKLIISDLDGTLLPSGKKSLSRDTLSAIEKQLKKGNIFAVASGRPYCQLKNLFGELSHKIFFICLDGALMIHRDCVLYKKPLCKDETLRLSGLYGKTVLYGRNSETVLDGEKSSPFRKQAINAMGSEVFKLAAYGEPLNTTARVCYNAGGICEYVNADVNKGTAAQVLMQKLGVPRKDTVAIGDGENDTELLNVVETPFITKKHHPALSNISAQTVSDATALIMEL